MTSGEEARTGGALLLPVSAGRHRVRARTDWTDSPAVEVDCAPGAPVELRVQPAGSALTVVLHMMTPQRYLKLDAV